LDVESAEGKRVVEKMAAAILRKADRHSTNGSLTVSEMRAFLRGTEYHGFSAWLSAPGQKDPHWKEHDANLNGTMELPELEKAVKSYLRENSEAAKEEAATQSAVREKMAQQLSGGGGGQPAGE